MILGFIFSGLQSVFDYQKSIKWDDNIQDLISWFSSQKTKQAHYIN